MSSNQNVEESVIIPQRGRSRVAKRLTSSSTSSSPSFSRPRSSAKQPADAVSADVAPHTASPSGSRHAFETRTASGAGRGEAPQDASGSSSSAIDASQSDGGGRLTTEPESSTAVPLPETQAATTLDTKARDAPSETPDPTQPQDPPGSGASGSTGPSASAPLNRQQVQEVAELLFMSSTLDACFEMPSQFSTAASGSDPGVPSAEGSSGSDELEDSDNGVVVGPEDEYSEELDEDEDEDDEDVDLDYEFVKNAPLIMQRFHVHGEVSQRVEAEALKLALEGTANRTSTGARRNEVGGAGVLDSDQGDDKDDTEREDEDEEGGWEEDQEDEEALLQVYHDMLSELDKLHTEAVELEDSILKLTKISLSSLSDPPESTDESTGHDRGDEDSAGETSTTQTQSPRSQIVGVIAACLPVIRARKSNLLMAQELIDSALENLSITLRMESLGLE